MVEYTQNFVMAVGLIVFAVLIVILLVFLFTRKPKKNYFDAPEEPTQSTNNTNTQKIFNDTSKGFTKKPNNLKKSVFQSKYSSVPPTRTPRRF